MATPLLLRQRTQPYGGRGVYIYIYIYIFALQISIFALQISIFALQISDCKSDISGLQFIYTTVSVFVFLLVVFFWSVFLGGVGGVSVFCLFICFVFSRHSSYVREHFIFCLFVCLFVWVFFCFCFVLFGGGAFFQDPA